MAGDDDDAVDHARALKSSDDMHYGRQAAEFHDLLESAHSPAQSGSEDQRSHPHLGLILCDVVHAAVPEKSDLSKTPPWVENFGKMEPAGRLAAALGFPNIAVIKHVGGATCIQDP